MKVGDSKWTRYYDPPLHSWEHWWVQVCWLIPNFSNNKSTLAEAPFQVLAQVLHCAFCSKKTRRKNWSACKAQRKNGQHFWQAMLFRSHHLSTCYVLPKGRRSNGGVVKCVRKGGQEWSITFFRTMQNVQSISYFFSALGLSFVFTFFGFVF